MKGKLFINEVDQFEYDMTLYEVIRDKDGNIVEKKRFTSAKINQINSDKIDIVVDRITGYDYQTWSGGILSEVAEDIAKNGNEAAMLMLGYGYIEPTPYAEYVGGALYFIANNADRVVNAEIGDYKVDINSINTDTVGAYGIYQHYNNTNYVTNSGSQYSTYKKYYDGWSNDGLDNRHDHRYYNSEGLFDRNISPYSGNSLDLDYRH